MSNSMDITKQLQIMEKTNQVHIKDNANQSHTKGQTETQTILTEGVGYSK